MLVMLVEDDIVTRMRLRRMLEADGHTVIECADGGTALKLFFAQPNRPDMVITDWMMPEMDGLHLAGLLRALTLEGGYIYIILLTSRSGTNDLQSGFQVGGVDDYVVKPFSADELRLRIKVGQRVVDLEKRHREDRRALDELVSLQTRHIRAAQIETVERLVAGQACCPEETRGHLRRVGLVSAFLAEKIGWSKRQVDDVRVAAAMHDIGKSTLPASLLNKQGALSLDEMIAVQAHTVNGGRILGGSDIPLLQMACEICLHHHEKWDGTGYPYQLAGADIPQSARIVAVAEVFDALLSDRVYRPALSEADALDIMATGRTSHFDPDIYDVFIQHVTTIQGIRRDNP